jgi:hypothetical protein
VDTSGRMLLRALIATALATVALAAPAAAAVTLAPLKPCYASDGQGPEKRETILIHATGFTPDTFVDLQIDGQTLDTTKADAFGAVIGAIPAPFQGSAGGGERAFSLTVVEQGNPANFATLTSRVSNLSVTLRPNPARPSQKVRFRGRGFTKDHAVFAHYVFGGVLQKTVRLVQRPVLPCGVFSVKRRQIPVRNARVGDWRLQIDQQRQWAERPASNMQAMTIKVRETFLKP